MILTNIKEFTNNTDVEEKVKVALEEVLSKDLLLLREGKHELTGDNFFLRLNYTTKDESECSWESHKKFIDVHCVLEGAETVGHQNIKNLTEKTEYDSLNDYILYNGEGNKFLFKKDDIAIFFPEDGHITGIAQEIPQEVKKIVLKVLY